MAGLRFGSVCSGIEAASVAWEPLGFEPAWFSEIEAFPNAVLAHHWPKVPNLGDITSADFIERARDCGNIDILVGGTPCQGFSHAGNRGGLEDPRSALAIRFIEIARSLKPQWVVWENVPGCLTTDGGRDFGAFIGQVADCGYRWAYRVCDAQFFGVPQRRRRVFLVGHLGVGRPEKVLFESEGEGRDFAESGETGSSIAGASANSPGGVRVFSNGGTSCWSESVGTMRARDYKDGEGQGLVVQAAIAINNDSRAATDMVCQPLRAGARAANMVAYQCHGSNVGPIGTLRRGNGGVTSGVPFVAMATQESQSGYRLSDTFATLDANYGSRRHNGAVYFPADTPNGDAAAEIIVRRLTPRECERLQGFPDDHTLVTYRKKIATDGPRYKSLGNSIAVPVMRWIGARLFAESNRITISEVGSI